MQGVAVDSVNCQESATSGNSGRFPLLVESVASPRFPSRTARVLSPRRSTLGV